MEKRINVAEILKNCHTGMSLDCLCFENVVFDRVDHKNRIRCFVGSQRDEVSFNEYGCLNGSPSAKCVIFPKGETTWEGFVPPCKFKDGDILVTGNGRIYECIAIFKENKSYWHNEGFIFYVLASLHTEKQIFKTNDWACSIKTRLATEEEKQKFFKVIKDNGYKWNSETKTLEKLIEPKFKVGDRIKTIYKKYHYVIKEITDTHYTLEEVEDKYQYTEPINEDKNWELVPNKFDISTLKPFDKVLVRNTNTEYWRISLFGAIVHDDRRYFLCMANSGFYQCIPYEHNEHLLGTSDDCDDFYKTWENEHHRLRI